MLRLLLPIAVLTLAVSPAAARPGDDVAAAYLRALQEALPQHGYDPGPPTGRLDPATGEALRAYQADVGLPQSADVLSLKRTLDRITFGAAAEKPAAAPAAAPPAEAAAPAPGTASAGPLALPPAPDPATIRLVQARLKARGYDIPASGQWDLYTVNAVKAFEAEHGLPRDGRVDERVLSLLSQ